jgi:hypothetical protein
MRVVIAALGALALLLAGCKRDKAAEARPSFVAERPCASTFQDYRTRYRYEGAPATCSGPAEMLVAGCPAGDEISHPTAGTTWRTYAYDREHRLVAIEIRTAADGPVTTKTTYAYGPGGLSSAAVDRGNDGTADTTIEYRREGDAVMRTQDTGADGKPDFTDTQRFDAAGRLATIDTVHIDGSLSSTTTFEWNGKRLVAQHIEVAGTTLETTYLYDCPP